MSKPDIKLTLDTKIDEFMQLTPDQLAERKRLIEEYIDLVVTNVENHPTDFVDNRLRRNEIASMRTLADVFRHRIDELKEAGCKKEPKGNITFVPLSEQI